MSTRLRMAAPKGRIFSNVRDLLAQANIDLPDPARAYRADLPERGLSIKLVKPQNIPGLVELGAHDVGFCGRDWIAETGAQVEILLDTGLDPVRIVAAAPVGFTAPTDRKLRVASEYATLAARYIEQTGVDAMQIRTYGATEVFPPEDADVIVDVCQTGETLRRNNLEITRELMQSTTVFIANADALADPARRERIDQLVLLLRGILAARGRVLLEMNVQADNLEPLVALLPCMKSPTVQPLHGGGFAVKVAVPRADVPDLIPRIQAAGASDVIEYSLNKVIL